jgi:hypothetical protein
MSTEPEKQPVPVDEINNKALPLVVSEIRGWIRDVFFVVGTAIMIVIFLYQPVKVGRHQHAAGTEGSGEDLCKQVRVSIRKNLQARHCGVLVSP